jgi:hypothetical protein
MYEKRVYLEIDTTVPGWSKTLLSLQKTFAGTDALYSGNLLTTMDGKLIWYTMQASDAASAKVSGALAPYVVNKLTYSQMQARITQLITQSRFKDPTAIATVQPVFMAEIMSTTEVPAAASDATLSSTLWQRHKWKIAAGGAAAAAMGAAIYHYLG